MKRPSYPSIRLSGRGRCHVCEGAGGLRIERSMWFRGILLSDFVLETCPACGGTGEAPPRTGELH